MHRNAWIPLGSGPGALFSSARSQHTSFAGVFASRRRNVPTSVPFKDSCRYWKACQLLVHIKLIYRGNHETNTKVSPSIYCMRWVIYIAVVLLFSPWIVLVGAKKATVVAERALQLTSDGSTTQLPTRTPEEVLEEFARTEAERQASVVQQLERDAVARQAATLRLIEQQAAERQASMLATIRRDVLARQASMMKIAQLQARKRNAAGRLQARRLPTP